MFESHVPATSKSWSGSVISRRLLDPSCVNLQRPRTIKIKAQNEVGAKVSLTITDEYLARIFQHEYDHLEVCHLLHVNAPLCCCQPSIDSNMCHAQGILFHDKFSAKSLEDARPELIYMEKMFQQHNPGVKFQTIQ